MAYSVHNRGQDWYEEFVIDERFRLESCLLRTEDFVLWKGRDQKSRDQHSNLMITEHLPGKRFNLFGQFGSHQ